MTSMGVKWEVHIQRTLHDLPSGRHCRGERDGDGFFAGFVMGGVVFGTLGFLFAPQVSVGRCNAVYAGAHRHFVDTS